MSKILISSSSDKNVGDREIDEYYDNSSDDSSSDSESNGNSCSTNELFSSRTPGIPLEIFQEKMRRRSATRSSAGLSTTP